MKTTFAFFRLIRWPNLVFIVITQLLFYFCVYNSLLTKTLTENTHILFYLLIVASVCIAAAGYIINDYFDVQIDAINKPNKMVINKFIKRRWAIIWHGVLSCVGIAISFYISYKIKVWPIFIVNIVCVWLLWVYSTTFKRKILIGNFIIAVLTAWVILVVYFFAGANVFSLKGFALNNLDFNARKLFKFTMLYTGFAFVATLIREVLKDLEDMDGDRQYQCNTMPIAWGVPASKVFVAVWIVVLIGTLLAIQLYAWQSGHLFAALYIVGLIILPAAILLQKMFKSSISSDYNKLSKIVKIIMLAGILSMLFLYKFF